MHSMNGLLMNSRMLCVVRHLLVAIAYGTAYAAIREISLASISIYNWLPEAGLRFTCFLLMPTRYWPALIFGETVALTGSNYAMCMDGQGPTWMIVNSVPRALEVAPFVWLLRRFIPGIRDGFVRWTPQLLACFAAAATGPTLYGWFSYTLLRQLSPGEPVLSFGTYFGQMFMGHYLAILSFTPVALWGSQRIRHALADREQARKDFDRFVQSCRWLMPAALVIVNGLMVLLGRYGGDAGQRWAIVGIFATLMPVTWSYGWPITAVVGAAANIAVASIMPAYGDVSTLSAQVLLLLFLSTLLMFAAKTSTAEQHKEDEREAIRHTRRAYMLTERHRLASANHMEDVLDDARLATTRLIQCARPFVPAPILAEHHRQFQALHERYHRLLLGLSPCEWWELGNPDGLIVSALRGESIGCDVLSMPLHAQTLPLSVEIGVAIKQLTCEATLHLLDCAPRDRISMEIAVAKYEDGHVIQIALETTGHPTTLNGDIYERLMVGMGAFGLNEKGLRRRAQLYDGDVEVSRSSDGEARIAIQLLDKPMQMIA